MAFTKIAAAGIGSTELVTLHSLEVLNNATVGGVLTYEDVTNVDSVGLITARNGIVVGSGITLSKDGDIFATGIVTATSFVGSGANLTGVASTENIRTNTNATFLQNINVSGSTTTGSAKVGVDTGVYGEDLVVTGNARVTGITTFGTSNNPASMLNIDDSSGTSTISIPDSIIHSGDTNTKIRFPAADTFSVETGGSERARIDSSGRLLLGHTAVGSKSAAAPLQIQTADSGAFALNIRNRTSNNDYGFITFSDDDASEDLAQIGVQRTAADTADIFFYTNGGASGSSERLRINSSGYVGINDTNPLATLHVEGHNITNGTVFLEPHSSKGNNISHIHHGSAGNWYIRPADASGYIYHDIGKSQFTNGILFGSDTADANTLDDYEEGTWTPVASNFTITTQYSANYTKIGNVVYVQAYLQAATGSGTGAVALSNLPFTVKGSNYYSYAACRIGGSNAQHDMVFQFSSSSTNVIPFVYDGNINEAMISGQHLIFSGFYHI